MSILNNILKTFVGDKTKKDLNQITPLVNQIKTFEKELEENPTDLVLVVGDVTSTMACALVAKKLNTKVAHVEGGIRSGDMTMPEEINRIVTDSIADYFFTTSELANQNLKAEGIKECQLFLVGNTMIDGLLGNMERLIQPPLWNEYDLENKGYLVMTLHRPSNVDGYENLRQLLSLINDNVGDKKGVFPMHPRTKKMFDQFGIAFDKLIVTGPMSYLEFIYMIKHSAGVVTDSGGITEETTVLNVPCMTLRNSTERPETVTMGTNVIVGTDPNNIVYRISAFSVDGKKLSRDPE